MKYIVVGLGNPGEEFEHTRHNVGRMIVERVAEHLRASDWRDDKKLRARIAQAKIAQNNTAVCVLPDNYMNRSGGAVAPLVTTPKQAERLIVVHDDIDLPLGTLRIVFDRGAGGHNGVLSIERAIKTRAFVRVRVGVLPTTPSGKLKKPHGDAVYDFILKPLTKKESASLEPILARATLAVCAVLEHGREAAMREYNTSLH